MLKPIAYKVSDRDAQTFRAAIDIGFFRLTFVEVERKGRLVLVLESKARLDGARIHGRQSLEVPSSFYKAAKDQAYAIRRDQRLKRAQLN